MVTQNGSPPPSTPPAVLASELLSREDCRSLFPQSVHTNYHVALSATIAFSKKNPAN